MAEINAEPVDEYRPEASFAPDLLAGKVCVVTGGATGIGRAIARSMGRLGAKVVIASRNVARLEAEAAVLASRGVGVLAVPTNVREPAECERMIARTVERFGAVDVLVNNAGANFLCAASQISPNGWRTIVDVVLGGTFHAASAAAKVMLGRGGVIVNMAATNGWNGSPMMAHSGAAKAGVINLTQTLAVEWAGGGVRVNAVAPGPVSTEGANSRLWAEPETMRKLEARIPLGRFARAEDCVGPVLFLCSDAARFMTGAILQVDGGDALRRVPDLTG